MLGGSGSGKSFFMNHLVRQYWEQGAHIVLVDTGNSYSGLCEMIRRKTHGDDGVGSEMCIRDRGRRGVFHLYGGKPDQFQPLLYAGQGV